MAMAVAIQETAIKLSTPIERGQRYARLRASGMVADDATRQMFQEDVLAVRSQRPTWAPEDIALHLVSRGIGARWGYQWAVRIAREV
jgi:hypothetical protein